MFDTALMASNRRREVKRKFATLPAALAVHALAFGFVMAGQLWAVDRVQEVESVPPLIVHIPPPPGDGGGHGPRGQKRSDPLSHSRSTVVQPREVPDVDPSKVADRGETSSVGVPGTEHLDQGPGGEGGGGGFGDGGIVGSETDVGAPDTPQHVGGDIVAPVPLVRTTPEYPELARKLRREGFVIIQAVIDRDGNVAGAELLRDIGFGCGAAALQAVREWKYRPATLAGRPVTVYLTVTVNFELRGVS